MKQRAEKHLEIALGGNMNIASLKPLALIEIMTDFAKKEVEAIDYNRCRTELNPDFAISEQVLLTKRTLVTIETFCEDGMIEIDDNNEYYKVDKEELTKRV